MADPGMPDATRPDPGRPGPVLPELPLGRDTVFWQVAGHNAHLLAARSALLLQVAHPAVAAAVDEHSPYASDPWGRTASTMDTVTKLCFGTPAQSAAAAGSLRRAHAHVTGTDARGCPYRAWDPELGLWVWATLTDGARRAYELVRGPLAADELESFYAGARAFALGCGVPAQVHPPDWRAFLAYVNDTVASQLEVTDAARTIAHVTAVVPVPGPVAPASHRLLHLCTAGLLDGRVRDAYGFDWTARDARSFERLARVLRRVDTAGPARAAHAASSWVLSTTAPPRLGPLRAAGARVTTARRAQATPDPGDPGDPRAPRTR